MNRKRKLLNISLIKKKNSFFIVLCVIFVGFIGYSYFQTRTENSAITSSSERVAPNFELPDLQGKFHRLDEYRGQMILLHFWASWCAPCLDEIPQWVELAQTFAKKPLKLVAISLDQSWEDAQKVLPSQKLPENVISLLDLSAKTPDLYGTYQFPETYLIGPDQKIKAKWVGPQDWGSDPMRKQLEQMAGAISGSLDRSQARPNR
jgi:thiol-disulfide isomerase/thioredoxin